MHWKKGERERRRDGKEEGGREGKEEGGREKEGGREEEGGTTKWIYQDQYKNQLYLYIYEMINLIKDR